MAAQNKNINKIDSQLEFEKICDRVVADKISFKKAIDESNICLKTFYNVLKRKKENEAIYNYAREIRSDTLFEEIIEIADSTEEGETICTKIEDGEEIVTKREKGDMIRHRELRIDARKWVVSKMCPKKYGDKIDVTSNQESINNTSAINLNVAGKVIDLSLHKKDFDENEAEKG